MIGQPNRRHIEAGLIHATKHYLRGGYDGLIESSFQSFQTGNEEAYFVPAVRLVLDMTLSALKLAEEESVVDPKQMREVLVRSHIASLHAKEAALLATKRQTFLNMYLRRPRLREITIDNEGQADSLHDGSYLGSLGASIFTEVRAVSGGALRFLQKRQVPGTDIPEIISASAGLYIISRVPKSVAGAKDGKMWRNLGEPYVDTRRLTMRCEGARTTVDFNEATHSYLRRCIGQEPGGCPALRLAYPNPENPDKRVNVLQVGWRDAVTYLVPPNATADVGH